MNQHEVDGDRPSQRTLVIVPTYNERDNLPLIAGRLHAARPDVHLLVVVVLMLPLIPSEAATNTLRARYQYLKSLLPIP